MGECRSRLDDHRSDKDHQQNAEQGGHSAECASIRAVGHSEKASQSSLRCPDGAAVWPGSVTATTS